MENLIYLLGAAVLGALGYSQYLKMQTNQGQADLEKKLDSNKEKIAEMESDLKNEVNEINNEIGKLEAEKQKDVSGEELAKFFNDFFNKSK